MMTKYSLKEISGRLIEKATEFGACAAGIADVEAVKNSPSHIVYPKIGDYTTIGNRVGLVAPGEVVWPSDVKSVIVVAVEHAEAKPELDWWIAGYSGGTPGNRKLVEINDKLAVWLENETGIKTTTLRYHTEHGGILLKDAAVLAGLGCLGKNNLLVTPQYGPRVRLRAMLTDVALPGTGPIDFDPCEGCDMPCRPVCPQKAFGQKIYSKKDLGTDQLPARSGVYSRPLCNRQMLRDSSNSVSIRIEGEEAVRNAVNYCRLCELSCPLGQPHNS